jgi:hypothetical protein
MVDTMHRSTVQHSTVRCDNHCPHPSLVTPFSSSVPVSVRAVTEAELPKAADLRPQSVFISPNGQHALVSCRHPSAATAELYYHHVSFPRPRALPHIKGAAVTAVAWDKQQPAAEAAVQAG